jgi:hypothetical protein
VEEIQQSGDRRGQKAFLQKKAAPIAEEKNTTMENIMNQLKLREDEKRSATQIKMVRGKLRSGGVSKVTYLDYNGVVYESTGRENLEESCNKAIKAKLQQTAYTPFMTGALQEDSGWIGIGPSVCMMLDGTYDPPPPRRWMSTFRSLSSSYGKISRRLNMILCIK